MSLPPWDDEMKFELLRLKSELRPENFRTLAPPLGIRVQTSSKTTKSLFPHLAETPLPTRQVKVTTQQPPPQLGLRELAQIPSDHSQKIDWKRRSIQFGIAHLLDLAFVSLSLLMGLMLLAWLLDPQHMSWDLSILKEALPLQFIRKLHILALLVGVYTIFVLYWVFFRVVTGSTLGESCLGLRNETAGGAVSANGSADS